MSNSNILKIGSLLNKFPNNGSKIELSQELKDALVGVWLAYGKSNDSTDRNIIKNKIKDRGGDFVISNAAYEGMSGYNGYPVVFGANKTWDQMPTGTFTWNIEDNKLHITKALIAGNGLLFSYVKLNGSLLNVKEIPSFKIKVSGLEGKSKLWYRYLKTEDAISETIAVLENGTHELPKSYIPSDSLHNGVWVGFTVTPISEGVKEFDCDITIEVLPEYEGAFVTDGVNDLITSTKTVQEMLGGSNEFTVVSMMANLDSVQMMCNSNYNNTNGYNPRNTLEPNGVISMLGYTDKNGTTNNLNLIMGDKDSIKLVDKVNFNSDYVFYPAQYYGAYYKAAWYWTVIANKVLTTDQINQVIAYFNLDRTLKPDILCNITKQGITNDNHADFNDKLIDYSGNGRDIQMYNLAWKGGSGIAAKKFETIKDYNIIPDEGLQELTIYNEFSFKIKSIRYADRYWAVQSLNKTDMSYPVTIITDKDIIWRNTLNYTDADGVKGNVKKETNVPVNTPTQVFIYGFNDFDISDDYTKVNCVAYATRKDITEFTVTFIPSCKGGLLLDGVNDFGKVTGLPIYKDYTVIADYERTDIGNIEGVGTSPVLSKSYTAGQGSFIMNFIASTGNSIRSYSFGAENNRNFSDLARQIFYQSKYKSQGFDITAGTGIDGDSLWLGTARDNDSRFFNGAIYSLMSFPYSMSEFLIERQLKKHKLGTLYPDMVEFRPIVKSNSEYQVVDCYIDTLPAVVGNYYPINSKLRIVVTTKGAADEVISLTVNGVSLGTPSVNGNRFTFNGTLSDKSPSKDKHHY